MNQFLCPGGFFILTNAFSIYPTNQLCIHSEKLERGSNIKFDFSFFFFSIGRQFFFLFSFFSPPPPPSRRIQEVLAIPVLLSPSSYPFHSDFLQSVYFSSNFFSTDTYLHVDSTIIMQLIYFKKANESGEHVFIL